MGGGGLGGLFGSLDKEQPAASKVFDDNPKVQRFRNEKGQFTTAPTDEGEKTQEIGAGSSASTASPFSAPTVGTTGSQPQVETRKQGMSKEEQLRHKDLLRIWESRLHDQLTNCEKLTSEALKVDKDITSNTTSIQDIRAEQARLRSKQETVDHSISLVWDQQEALGQLLSGLQSALEGKLPASGVNMTSDKGSSPKPQERAKGLDVQLDELDRQVKDLTREAQDFQTARYSEPLVRVGHVLDAHSSELDAIEERVHAAVHRLRSIDVIS